LRRWNIYWGKLVDLETFKKVIDVYILKMEIKKRQPMTKEEFMRSIRFDSYLASDAQKNYRWTTSREYKELKQFENMMRFTRLQKLNKPNNYIIALLSNRTKENYFNKFNQMCLASKTIQDSFKFCRELLRY